MILGVDHILIAVEPVDAAAETYRRLGFEVLRGGEHPRMGTYNALVPLAGGVYLELIGVRDHTLAEQFPHTRRILAALQRPNRAAIFALDVTELDEDVEAARTRGVGMADPIGGERMRPDGQRVAWHSAHPENHALPFLLQDNTSRELRIPEPTAGLGRELSLAYVELGVGEVEAWSTTLAKYLGVEGERGRFALGRGAIQLVPAPIGASDGSITRIALAAQDLEEVAKGWQEAGVAFEEVEGRGEHAPMLVPHETAGAPLAVMAGARG